MFSTAANYDYNTMMPRAKWLHRFRAYMRAKPGALAMRFTLATGLGLLIYCFAYPQLDAYYHSWKADRALENQDCALALSHLQKCLNVWSDSGLHHFKAARCCWREEDGARALAHLAKARRAGWPRNALAIEELFVDAQRNFQASTVASLENMSERAGATGDREIQTLALEAATLAFLAVDMGEDAAFKAKSLVDLNSTNWRSHWLLGRALARHAPHIAAEAYRSSLELRPQQRRVHRWLAIYSAHTGQPESCLQHLRAAQPLATTDVEAKLAEVNSYYLLGKLSQARAALDVVWSHADNHRASAFALRGLIELEEGTPASAAAWLTKAETLAPRRADVIEAMLIFARRDADKEKVQNYQQRKQDRKEAGDRINVLRGMLRELSVSVGQQGKRKQELLFELGQCLLRFGEDREAIRCLQALLAENSAHHGAHQALAECYERLGDLEKAQEHWARTRSRG